MNKTRFALAFVLGCSIGCGGEIPSDGSDDAEVLADSFVADGAAPGEDRAAPPEDAPRLHVFVPDASSVDEGVADAAIEDRTDSFVGPDSEVDASAVDVVTRDLDAFTPTDAVIDLGAPTDAAIDRPSGATDAVPGVDSAPDRPVVTPVDVPMDVAVDAVVDRPDASVADVVVDVVVDRPDASVLDAAVDVVVVDAPVDRPDTSAVDAVVDRPDSSVVDAVVDVAIDRADTAVLDAVVDVLADRPDTAVVDAGIDAVVDRPDVVAIDVTVDTASDVVADRPDTTVLDAAVDTGLDVIVDRPDTAVADASADVAADVVTDRTVVAPDVAPDAAQDASSTIPPDPVAYVGTFSTRTDGRSFLLPMRINGNRRDVWIQMPVTLGPNPALMLAFHGTNGDGAVMLTDSGASTVIASNNVIFIAPTSRWFGGEGADFDHPGGNGTYWETANNPDPNTNEDLLLTRAIIQEARRAYNIDPARVYAYGHSNGGFMAYMVAQVLRDRVVGFGENSAGLSRCNPQQSCRFQGYGTTCAALSTQSGWCTCAGPELPVPVPTAGRHGPAILLHGTADPLVSVFHTCTLEALLRARGHTVSTTLFDGGGHYLSTTVASRVWAFLSPYRMP